MLSHKLEISRSRNEPKPLPISQRILGFEKKDTSDLVGASISPVSGKFPFKINNSSTDRVISNDSPNNKHMLRSRIFERKESYLFKNNECSHNNSLKYRPVSPMDRTKAISIIRKPDCSDVKEDMNFNLSYSKIDRKEAEIINTDSFDSRKEISSNFSHPNCKHLHASNSNNKDAEHLKLPNNSRVKDDYFFISSSEIPVENSKRFNDVPEPLIPNPVLSSISSFGIYKPAINRPTRYPRPSYLNKNTHTPVKFDLKDNSTKLDGRIQVRKFQTRTSSLENLSVKRDNEVNLSSIPEKHYEGNQNHLSKRKNVVEQPYLNQSGKPTLNNKRLPSPIQLLSNNRCKLRNRNFEPQNMDFSQLLSTDDENLNLKLGTHIFSEPSKSIDSRTNTEFIPISNSLHIKCLSGSNNRYTTCSTKSGISSTNNMQTMNDGKNIVNALSEGKKQIYGIYGSFNSPKDFITNSEDTAVISEFGSHSLNSTVDSFTDPITFKNSTSKKDNNSIINDINGFEKISLLEVQSIDKSDECIQSTSNSSSKSDLKTQKIIKNLRHVDDGPISLAQLDIQAWIEGIIRANKDVVATSSIISSKILEKTSHAIAHRHALERDKSLNYVTTSCLLSKLSKENYITSDLKHEQVSKAPLFSERCLSFETIYRKKAFGGRFRRSYSYPDILLYFNKEQYSSNLSIQDSAYSNEFWNNISRSHNSLLNKRSIFGTNSITDMFPTPPPNLPEVSSYLIPEPPPDIPNICNEKSEILTITSRSNENVRKTKLCKRSKVMKPLHWKRLLLHNRKQKCEVVWKGLPKVKLLQNEITFFEELFENHTSRKNNKLSSSEAFLSLKPKEILSPEVSKQFGIILKKIDSLHITLDNIEEMLYSGDIKRTNLTTSLLESLCRLVTDEQIQNIKSFVKSNPTVELTKESRTVLFFSSVPHVNLRLKHILNMQNFDEDIENIDRNLTIIINCCRIFRESSELKILLAIILLLGNHMNQAYDSFRDATGFNLELLPRLKETKSKDNSKTFLEYVSRVYLQKFEHEDFHGSPINILPFPDTGDLLIASTTTLQELQKALNKLGEQIIKIREDTMHLIFEGHECSKSKQFLELVEKFFIIAEKRITEECDLLKTGFKSFQELIYYFYGDFKVSHDADTNQFFGIWCEFATIFKDAIVREHKNMTIQKRNTLIQTCTKITPITPTGLKFKVKYRKGFKGKSYTTQASVDLN